MDILQYDKKTPSVIDAMGVITKPSKFSNPTLEFCFATITFLLENL